MLSILPLFQLILVCLVNIPMGSNIDNSTQADARSTPEKGKLIVAYQSVADTHFIRTTLPFLKDLSSNQDLEFISFQDAKELPKYVTATPAIFFRNHNGQAMFGGKYVEHTAIENFLRVSKIKPVRPVEDTRKDILQTSVGRQKTVIPLKVTAQKGNYPEVKDWSEAIQDFFTLHTPYQRVDKTDLWPSDRKFYLDVHPYVDASGKAFVSAAVFSQFDCIVPIWENFENPIEGSVHHMPPILKQLCREVKVLLEKRLNDWDAGDALSPVSEGVTIVDWNEKKIFGESSPFTTQTYPAIEAISFTNPKPAEPDLPMLQFNFPAPLDRYAGEVRKMDGSLTFSEDRRAMSGVFVAKIKTVTMGMKDLDRKVLKSYLYAKDYPEATFSFTNVDLERAFDGGEVLSVHVPGTFEMIGKTHSVIVNAMLEPTELENGKAGLRLTASFGLDIAKPFGLKGPDGPEAIRNKLQFQVYCLLYPI